jgi:AhpD family alkylhydroperoxidase
MKASSRKTTRERTIRPAPESDLPVASRELLEALKATRGHSEEFFLAAGHSPAAFEALHGLVRASRRSALPERLRRVIALRVAQLNESGYGVAVEAQRAREAGLDDASILNSRRGISDDPKEQALLSLATKIVEDRGHHAGLAVRIARSCGATDAELVEVILLITLSIFTDYLSNIAGTEPHLPFGDLKLNPEENGEGEEYRCT